MARGSKTRHDSDDTTDISSPERLLSTPVPMPASVVSPYSPPVSFDDIWPDRRFYDPESPLETRTIAGTGAIIGGDYESVYRPPFSELSPSVTDVPLSPNRPFQTARMGVHFVSPETIGVCIRRKARREVLHALNRTKRGSGGRGRRRGPFSDVKC